MIYLVIYSLLSFVFVAFFFIIAYKNGEMDSSKENLFVTAMCIFLCPLSVIAFLVALTTVLIKDKRRKACIKAMHKWESKAKEGYEYAWDWYVDQKKKELRYNLMRETVGFLSDKELHLLVTCKEDTFTIEKSLRDTLMDEIIDRELRKL